MNDNEKSVTILDPSGNTYFMEGAGNIKATAPKNMTFNVGENMNIIVGKDMLKSTGNTQDLKVTKDITVSASNHNEKLFKIKS